jgi:hypothetical protein
MFYVVYWYQKYMRPKFLWLQNEARTLSRHFPSKCISGGRTYLILFYGTTHMHHMRANIFGFRVTPQIMCLCVIYGFITPVFLHSTTHCRYVALPCGLSVRLLTCSPVAPQVCNTDKSQSLPHIENDNHCWRSPWHSTVCYVNRQQTDKRTLAVNTPLFASYRHCADCLSSCVSSAKAVAIDWPPQPSPHIAVLPPSSAPRNMHSREAVCLVPAGYPTLMRWGSCEVMNVFVVRCEWL